MTTRSSTSRPTGRSLGGLCLVALLLSGPAYAAGGDDFKAHFDKARECYDRKDFECAVTELKAAYEIKPLTALLLNIGHAYLDWGRPAQARDYYDLYLATDKKLSPAQRAEVEKYRADAQAKLAEQQAAQQAAQQQAAQQPPPPEVTPPAPVAPPVPKAEEKTSPPTGPIVLLSSGAALLVIGLGLGGGALAASKDVVRGDGPFDSALDSRGRTLNAAGIAFDVLGGVAFAAGAVWGISWLVKHRRDPNVTPIARLKLVPSGAGLLVQGRF